MSGTWASLAASANKDTTTGTGAAINVSADQERKKVAVLDTAVFIKGIRPDEFGGDLYTVQEVVDEIRDKKSKTFAQETVTLSEIKLKEPSPDAMKMVIDFAKRSGDYANLSHTDVKVLALSLHLDMEYNGKDHINTEPISLKDARTKATKNLDQTPGFVKPKTWGNSTPFAETLGSATVFQALAYLGTGSMDEYSAEIGVNDQELRTNEDKQAALQAEARALREQREQNDGDNNDGPDMSFADDEGWITPDNLDTAAAAFPDDAMEDEAEARKERAVLVGCVTTDFTMQNVLLHMNMLVFGIKGYIVRKVQHFVMMCTACSTTTSNMAKEFCPKCGNHSMMRTKVVSDKNGAVRYVQPRQISLRGTKYSIPTPKGGRHNSDLILREDQKERATRRGKPVHKVYDDRDLANGQPFATTDISAKLRAANTEFGYGRRNPNERRRRKK
eukprot:Clim_evm53s210 gene=Clim_evmTU53s210